MNDQAQSLRGKYKQHIGINENNGTRVIAITSGKGGVGKSSIALNLSLEMAQKGKRVYLLDGDMGMANLHVLLGISPKYTLTHVMTGQKDIDDIVLDGPCGIKLISGGTGFYEMANLSKWRLQQFILKLRAIAELADFLIIDTGAGISETVLTLVLAAEHILVVTTPEPTAITDAYGGIKAIISHERKTYIELIINMVKDYEEASLTGQKLQAVARSFLNTEIGILGHVVNDRCVPNAVANQDPFVLSYPNSEASKCIKRVSQELLSFYGMTTKPSLHSNGTLQSFLTRLSTILQKKA